MVDFIGGRRASFCFGILTILLGSLTSVLNVALFATGKAVSPPSSTSFKKYSTVIYLKRRK